MCRAGGVCIGYAVLGLRLVSVDGGDVLNQAEMSQ